jgi:ADP-ribose pyrophosphatase YjhB (NUDIX family)
MALSEYVRRLRERVGHDLLLLPGTAAVVRDAQGRVLLQRRRDDGLWDLPGGASDAGDSPSEAVVRKVREETGLEVRPLRLLGVFGGRHERARYPNGDEAEFTTIVFECEIVGGELRPEEGEADALRFHPGESPPPMRGRYGPRVIGLGAHSAPLYDPPGR